MAAWLLSPAIFHFLEAARVSDPFRGCQWQFGGLTTRPLAWHWQLFCQGVR